MTSELTNTSTTAMIDQVIRQVLGEWNKQIKAATAFFTKFDNNTYQYEIAPGRNRAIYLLGHLIAVHDGMLPLLGFGERLYPGLQEMFLGPDKSINEFPSLEDLKHKWDELNTTLSGHFNRLSTNEWLEKHTAVSAEDFAKDPLRNKLNVVLNRTNHISYHLGQLNLMRP